MSDEEARLLSKKSGISWQRVLRWEVAFLAIIVVLIGVSRLPTLDNKLLEAHAYRQTFTAFQTVGFYESGIDLLHPTNPVLGSPWETPAEFPLFQAVASIPMSWGIPADVANRGTALGFFVLSALALWTVVRLIADRATAAVSVIVFSFSPLGLLWSRASMIEYLATLGALIWVLGLWKWRDNDRLRWLSLSILGGAVVATVKITTAIAWVAPLVLYPEQPPTDASPRWRTWFRDRLRPGFVAALIIPALLGAAWTRHRDGIQEASPIMNRWPEEGIARWLGTFADRLDLRSWGSILNRISELVVGYGWLVLAIAAVVVVTRNRTSWVGIALVPLTGASVFLSPYVVQDYYVVAATPALAAILALGITWLARWIATKGPTERAAFIGVLALWLVWVLAPSFGYWSDAYAAPTGAPPEAVEIQALTSPDDLVIVGGINWDSRVLYYAERRGLMIYEPYVTREIAQSQPDLDEYRAFYLAGPLSHLAEWAAIRDWYAPATPHTMLLGSSLADLGDVSFAATTRPLGEVTAIDALIPLELTANSIRCNTDDRISLPGGTGDLWVSMQADGEARPVMDLGLVPIPAATATMVWRAASTEAERPAAELSCINAGSVTIDVAYTTAPSNS